MKKQLPTFDFRERTIGTLFKKISKKGKNYLSGNIVLGGLRYNIICFENHYWKDLKDPKYSVLLAGNDYKKF
jgi:hypothetical protein